MTEITLSTGGDIPLVGNMVLLADNPAGMLDAQKGLVLWCEAKMGQVDAQRIEAVGNAQRAKAAKWSGEEKRWNRVAARAKMTWHFYDKVKAALDAGYYIVPPFPTQIFAIRTTRQHAIGKSQSGHWNDHKQKAQMLPRGEGEYQNPHPEVLRHTDNSTNEKGEKIVQRWTVPGDFLPLEFPIGLVKPQILEATTRAMALKIFDDLGVLPAYRAPDPIIMGRIRNPTKPHYDQGIHFFVAWWLETSSL